MDCTYPCEIVEKLWLHVTDVVSCYLQLLSYLSLWSGPGPYGPIEIYAGPVPAAAVETPFAHSRAHREVRASQAVYQRTKQLLHPLATTLPPLLS
jgi:hypothetical protein